MNGQLLKRAAIERALEAPPHQLRAWVRELEPFCSRDSAPRRANEYSLADLAYLFVVKMLVTSGFQLDKIKPISQELYKAIVRPMGPKDVQTLYLREKDGWELTAQPDSYAVTVLVPVRRAWDFVRAFVNADVGPLQANLQLGPTDISKRPRQRARRQ